jgi:Cu(I)/Ag(I) efflux system membrane fusion protein
MKRTILIPLTLFALSTLIVQPVLAEGTQSSQATTHQGRGTVNSVDVKSGKINLNHEPIQSLDWPGMTMDFDVQDKAALSKLKPGQKVAFSLIEARRGKYVISQISAVK